MLPQRYEFSSKSQLMMKGAVSVIRCCCYRKGTNFQANHNLLLYLADEGGVVVATAKVRIFKQITTTCYKGLQTLMLLLLPQRYEFSSKSQQEVADEYQLRGCCCYRKGTNFQANHNTTLESYALKVVVVATAKVRIFKQITTRPQREYFCLALLLLPQRYEFSSKSQHCRKWSINIGVVVATAKVRIFKQITTFSSTFIINIGCCCYRKGTNFQANHNKVD